MLQRSVRELCAQRFAAKRCGEGFGFIKIKHTFLLSVKEGMDISTGDLARMMKMPGEYRFNF